jgi:PTH1 family peptidyl-tRNA hydrolase
VGEGSIGGNPVVLAKPRTFMNNSGEAISYLMNKFHLTLENLLVIYDDLDLPLGKIRIRPNGGSGGHRGIGSIMAILGNNDVARIRIGIGRSAIKDNEIEYVLGKFDADEKEIIKETNAKIFEIINIIVSHGIDEAMNLHN